jgi:hypothetical protein
MCCAGPSQSFAEDDLRFAAIDIILTSSQPAAAWQFELKDRHGLMQVVGVEGGESAAFEGAPYYDREAVRLGTADRIVVADYSLADVRELPVGRVRIATIHLTLSGDASTDSDFELNLITATTRDGKVIDASISIETNPGVSHDRT